MTQIKDVQLAKEGLSGLFGRPLQTSTETQTPETLQRLEDKELNTKEEIVSSLSPETREELQKTLQRKQYLKSGRPPKGTDSRINQTRMTFLISPEKQERLREIALREGLFIKEVLDRGIDLVIDKYDKEGSI